MKISAPSTILFAALSAVALAQTVEVVHEFPEGADLGELTSSPDGGLFGALASFAKPQSGIVFKVGEKDEVVEVANFAEAPMGARYPTGTLIADGSWLWGVTRYGGETKGGTVFRVHSFTGKLEIVAAIPGTGFSTDSLTSIAFHGSRPSGWLHKESSGFLVGETQSSEAGFPSARFRVNLKTSEFKVLGSRKDTVAHRLTVADGLGNKWGVGIGSEKGSAGAILKLAPNGEVTTEVQFLEKETEVLGKNPRGLTPDNRGILWGVTTSGGARNAGTIFSLDPKAGEFRTVVEFGKVDGIGTHPTCRLVKDRDGMLWGISSYPGRPFSLNPASGSVTTPTGKGTIPSGFGQSTLMLHSDGNLYGTISEGISSRGILYRIRLQPK
jgi:uncharacterized repeat protein (TIGR03803 family)